MNPIPRRKRPLMLGRRIMCRECHGTGTVTCGYPDAFGWAEYAAECGGCRGTGGTWVSRLYPRQPHVAPVQYGPVAPDHFNIMTEADYPF